MSTPRKSRAGAKTGKPKIDPAETLAFVDLAAVTNLSLATIVRDDLVAYRGELTRAGYHAAARELTRLIANFDRISRGLNRAIHLCEAKGAKQNGGKSL